MFDPDTGIDYQCTHGSRCDDGGSGSFLNVCHQGKSCVPWADGPRCSKLCRVSADVPGRPDSDFPMVLERGGDPSYNCQRDEDDPGGTQDSSLLATDCVPFVHATSARYALSGAAGIPEGYALPVNLGVCLDHATFGEFYKLSPMP
ncbi:MAG: hypothetical protein DRH23_09650 [Deltaproteobacteria bacterium]|nr:hypothetical protein [Deltaproteobacteria bacterium]RLB47967.1 MAG: hypothetical protein DRH23_09650 [Deltaproteobacteria bacterium]